MPDEVFALDAAAVKLRALQLGFDLCGIAPAERFPELQFYREWLARGYAGEMQYLSRTADRRADVRAVLPSAQSVIVVASVYNTARPYSTEIADAGEALIARYAWGEDYHRVMGERLDALVAWLREHSTQPFDARSYVDTGPVQERAYAERAGIGWIGKNTCLINAELGSWIFLAEIISSLRLEPDQPALDRCGTCTLCLDACPTHALVAPGVLDATRCISYLTIEVKGSIPEELREGIGSHVYGCDICQEVCPWNAAPAVSSLPDWLPRPRFDRPELAQLWQTSDRDLRTVLRGSAMARTGVRGLRRNAAVAIGNCPSTNVDGLLEEAARDEARSTATHAIVAEHVEWSRRRR